MAKQQKYNSILFYIHDPMCSWCWAFRETWEQIQQQLVGKIPIAYLAGGLAADSKEPMPRTLQEEIKQHWKNIQKKVPDTQFNFDFWENNEPRRSTYPACRATIAARRQKAEKEMILAIQQSYYLKAENPSNSEVLLNLAEELSLDMTLFSERLNHLETQQRLLAEIHFSQQLGAQGFPGLVLQKDNVNHLIPIDYNNAEVSLVAITPHI